MLSPSRGSVALPRIHMSRPRLLQELSIATRCRLTLVCAEAGYGKTTLVTEFTQTQRSDRYAWLQLSGAHRDPAHLSDSLSACMGWMAEPPAPGRVRPTRSVSAPDGASRLSGDPYCLVLDDYHEIDEPGIGDFLADWIDSCPPEIHLIIVSRSVPRIPMARLRAKQEVSQLSKEDLAFTLAETSCFLRDVVELDLDDGALAQIHDRTEGWAAGLGMVAQSLLQGQRDRVMEIIADPVASAWLVYDYLAEEVFDRLDAHVQDFLAKTSILNWLDDSACDYLLDSSTSWSMLLSLEEGQLFTSSADHTRRVFRYHQLFREFLRQRLYLRERRESVVALHRKAAEYYQRHERWEDCVSHYLAAGDVERAALIVEGIGERYITAGLFQTVQAWLRALPEELTSTRPRLLVIAGRLHSWSANCEEAVRLLERALRRFQSGGDLRGQAETMGELAQLQLRRGYVRQSLRQYAVSIPLVADDPALKGRLLAMQAAAYRESGMLDEAAKACEASLEQLSWVNDERLNTLGQANVARELAGVWMERGDLREARSAAERAVALSTDHQLGDYQAGLCVARLGIVLWARGELADATTALRRAIALFSGHAPLPVQVAAMWLGNCLRDAGAYGEAAEAYRQSTRSARLEAIFMDLVGGRSSMSGDESIAVCESYRRSEAITTKTSAAVILAALLRQRGETDRALDLARTATDILRERGFRQREASALLHQAGLEFELSRAVEGRACLQRAFQLAETGGYWHFFWWDPILITQLCQRALVDDIHPPFAAELLGRKLGGINAVSLVALLSQDQPELRLNTARALSSLKDRSNGSLRDAVLAGCADLAVRSSLLQAVGDRLISSEGVRLLRTKWGLSWREVQVMVEYYLRPASEPASGTGQPRREYARRLQLSEHTLRCHVNSLRRKLALSPAVDGKQLLDWSTREGLLPSCNSPS
jgi:ATP/maltotriose-dependent transcriptional regulator MalT